MQQPTSIPVNPAQPDAAYYNPQSLALFQTFTRDTYKTAFGVDAPAFDASRAPKTWFDSTVDLSDPANVAVYKILGKDTTGAFTLKQMVIPCTEASTVNLPGTISYPAYVVAPTQATRGGSAINPNYLSLQADAQNLMAAIGGTSLVDEGNLLMFPAVYPADEARRWWSIVWKNTTVNAGLLLIDRNSQGVGAPGQWDLTGTEPKWVPTVAATGNSLAPRDMPLRALLPNEQLQAGPMAMAQVVRTDLVAASQQAAGYFTAADRETLQKILQLLSSKPAA